MEVYEHIVEKDYAICKVSVTCKNIMNEVYEQYDLFTDYTAMERGRKLQKATLELSGSLEGIRVESNVRPKWIEVTG